MSEVEKYCSDGQAVLQRVGADEVGAWLTTRFSRDELAKVVNEPGVMNDALTDETVRRMINALSAATLAVAVWNSPEPNAASLLNLTMLYQNGNTSVAEVESYTAPSTVDQGADVVALKVLKARASDRGIVDLFMQDDARRTPIATYLLAREFGIELQAQDTYLRTTPAPTTRPRVQENLG